MTIHARFDGRVIVPDKPLDLPLNQALLVQIEPVDQTSETVDGSALMWLAAHASESPTLPTDLADQHDRYLSGKVTQDK
jgi:hypothetical protein